MALQMIKPEEKVVEVKGCAAQLDAGALVAIVSHKPIYEGLRTSLQDIWLGHKEDPHKVLNPRHKAMPIDIYFLDYCQNPLARFSGKTSLCNVFVTFCELRGSSLCVPATVFHNSASILGCFLFPGTKRLHCCERWIILGQGAGVLLVGSSDAANAAAALALEKALPSSCRSCILSFKVPSH